MGIAKTGKRPLQQRKPPQYVNYWAPLTRKRHILPHSAQPRHTNHWAPRTRKRHQQEHWQQQPPDCSDPTQHTKGRTGDCPGPCKETTIQRNVTQGGGGGASTDPLRWGTTLPAVCWPMPMCPSLPLSRPRSGWKKACRSCPPPVAPRPLWHKPRRSCRPTSDPQRSSPQGPSPGHPHASAAARPGRAPHSAPGRGAHGAGPREEEGAPRTHQDPLRPPAQAGEGDWDEGRTEGEGTEGGRGGRTPALASTRLAHGRRQPPPTATNRRLPIAHRQDMLCPRAFLGKLCNGTPFFIPLRTALEGGGGWLGASHGQSTAGDIRARLHHVPRACAHPSDPHSPSLCVHVSIDLLLHCRVYHSIASAFRASQSLRGNPEGRGGNLMSPVLYAQSVA